MPQLTFPTSPDGLPVDVLIGLAAGEAASRRAAKQKVPFAVEVRGLLDTATDITMVHSSVLSQVGAPKVASATTNTAGGTVPVNVFEVRLAIGDARNPGGPMLHVPSLLVMELQHQIPNAACLIGLDILFQCKLFLDGPGQSFTLEF